MQGPWLTKHFFAQGAGVPWPEKVRRATGRPLEAHPYHLDYCFVPVGWTVRGVRVRGFVEWAGVSDLRPVVVDVEA